MTAALPCGAGQTGALNIELQGGRLAGDQDTFRFEQDEDVHILWTSDDTVALHLHGYDRTLTVIPGTPATMRFTGTTAGRFPITSHGSGSQEHRTLVYIEIYPR